MLLMPRCAAFGAFLIVLEQQINEALPQDGLRLLDPGGGRPDGALRKIDAGHCLIHLKRPPATRP